MEPFSFIINALAAAALSAVPVPSATVPGTIDSVSVSNTTVISQTATQITAEKAAADAKLAADAKEALEKALKEKEAAEKTDEAAKAETAKTAEKEHLQLPLKAGTYSYTSDFGLRCAPVTGAGNFHYGIDLAAPLGTPMYSIADGTVTSVTDGVNGGIGGDVQIESTINGKLMTLRYHHMGNSSQYVKVGDKVTAGQHISDVASTGMSTGAHLHLEVFEGQFKENKRIDPEEYFKTIGLPIVSSATANYVNKADHVDSCPGGYETGPLIAASATTQPTQPKAPAQPATPAAPATPAIPATPTAPAQPATPATPAQPAVPTPTTPASPLPTPTASPTSIARVTPSPTVSVEVEIPTP